MFKAVLETVIPKKAVTIIKATKEDTSILKDVLTKAFVNDPFTNWLVTQDRKKNSRSEIMHETIIKHFGLRYGHIYTTQDKKGCAVWIPPYKFNSNSFLNLLIFPAWLKVVGFKRLFEVMKVSKIIEKKHPGKNYFYLVSLGVNPELQGLGIGSDLIKPVLDICDRNNIPACLETSSESNLSFYKKHGFTIQEELELPNGAPKTWIMVREPIMK